MEKEKSFLDDYRDFIVCLKKNNVDFLVVGGYAVELLTKVPRATQDIDFWIRPTEENAEKTSKTVKEFSGLNVAKSNFMNNKEIFYSRYKTI